MFYSKDILTRKQGGFGIIWLAATLGARSNVRKLNKREVMRVNIAGACKYIEEPPEPLALRLSSNLLVGIMRVYGQQYDIYFHDLQNFFARLRDTALSESAVAAELIQHQAPLRNDAITLGENFDLDLDAQLRAILSGSAQAVPESGPTYSWAKALAESSMSATDMSVHAINISLSTASQGPIDLQPLGSQLLNMGFGGEDHEFDFPTDFLAGPDDEPQMVFDEQGKLVYREKPQTRTTGQERPRLDANDILARVNNEHAGAQPLASRKMPGLFESFHETDGDTSHFGGPDDVCGIGGQHGFAPDVNMEASIVEALQNQHPSVAKAATGTKKSRRNKRKAVLMDDHIALAQVEQFYPNTFHQRLHGAASTISAPSVEKYPWSLHFDQPSVPLINTDLNAFWESVTSCFRGATAITAEIKSASHRDREAARTDGQETSIGGEAFGDDEYGLGGQNDMSGVQNPFAQSLLPVPEIMRGLAESSGGIDDLARSQFVMPWNADISRAGNTRSSRSQTPDGLDRIGYGSTLAKLSRTVSPLFGGADFAPSAEDTASIIGLDAFKAGYEEQYLPEGGADQIEETQIRQIAMRQENDRFVAYVASVVHESGQNQIFLGDLQPMFQGAERSGMAQAFYHILASSSLGYMRPNQEKPYGPIQVELVIGGSA